MGQQIGCAHRDTPTAECNLLNTALDGVTVLAVRIDCITSSREQPRLLIVIQRKKGCVERILRVSSESYCRVPSLQHNQHLLNLVKSISYDSIEEMLYISNSLLEIRKAPLFVTLQSVPE